MHRCTEAGDRDCITKAEKRDARFISKLPSQTWPRPAWDRRHLSDTGIVLTTTCRPRIEDLRYKSGWRMWKRACQCCAHGHRTWTNVATANRADNHIPRQPIPEHTIYPPILRHLPVRTTSLGCIRGVAMPCVLSSCMQEAQRRRVAEAQRLT